MKIERYNSPREFMDDVEDLLLRAPRLNNLMLGLLGHIEERGAGPDDVFLTVRQGGRRLAGMISGLYLILYADTAEEAFYNELVRYLEKQGIDYPGGIGPRTYCDAFRQAYESHTGERMELEMRQRVFKIESIQRKSPLEGRLVQAKKAHFPWLRTWMEDFAQAMDEEDLDGEEKLNELIEAKRLFLLEHDASYVSMAAGIRPFQSGISIAYVYTPAEYRNQGYATKCVELLTERLLENYAYCTLYTDLSNPTSNSIYKKIGYRPVGDSVVYKRPSRGV